MAGSKRKRDAKGVAPTTASIKHFFDNQRKRQQLEQEICCTATPLQQSFKATRDQHREGKDTVSIGSSVESSKPEQSGTAIQKDPTSTGQEQPPKNTEPETRIAPTITFSSSSNTIADDIAVSQPLTTDALHFDPYAYPISSWPTFKGAVSAPYTFLASAFALIGDTSSRISMINVLCNMLQVLMVHTPNDVLPCLWLCSNRLGSGIELGIGPQVLMKAMTAVSGGLPASRLRKLYQDHGDWGDVAYAIKANIRTIAGQPQSLRVSHIFDQLRVVLAGLKGKGMVSQKAGIIQRLLVACKSGTEARYLIRTCVGNLRTGAVTKSVLLGLARACLLVNRPMLRRTAGEADAEFKRAQAVLKECYAQCPNWDLLLPWLQKTGWDVGRIFERCGITVGIPLKPMLGQITRSLPDIFTKLQSRHFVCESKYDGQRAQIHLDDQGNIKIYSRHLEDMTEKYPDIVHVLPDICQSETKSFIMDAEVVAVTEEGKILPFQILSNRERKNVTIAGIKVRVCIMAFDLMYLNGTSLLRLSFRDRRDKLLRHFKRIPGAFDFTNSLMAYGASDDFEMVETFFKESVKQGCEGMMVKVLDQPAEGSKEPLSTYEPDKRLESWLKVKKDYLNGVGDSLDLVPIGAWYGNGRKAGWFSPVLLACYNPENDTFESVCKCMSGFSDEFYKSMKRFYSEPNDTGTTHILEHSRHDYVTELQPDVWFDASEVWEIKGADITVSPVHKGALGRVHETRGLSLRFPRYIKTRQDKSIYDATTSESLAEMFSAQQSQAQG